MIEHLPPNQKWALAGLASLALFGLGFVGSSRLRQPGPVVIQVEKDAPVVSSEPVKPPVDEQISVKPIAVPHEEVIKVSRVERKVAPHVEKPPAKEIQGEIESEPRVEAPVDSSEPKHSGREPKAAPSGPINPNTASLEQLETLPGIGPVIAQRIIDYRTQVGLFKAPEDLMEVKGIGEKKFAKLRQWIRL